MYRISGIVEYGSILFIDAADSTLSLIDRVQNHDRRLTLGALKTTPILTVQYEANISPLFLRKVKLIQHSFYEKFSTSTPKP